MQVPTVVQSSVSTVGFSLSFEAASAGLAWIIAIPANEAPCELPASKRFK